MLSDFTNGGKQSKINSANYAAKSIKTKPPTQVGDTGPATLPGYIARGKATGFDANKYKIDNFSYPSDLMDTQYGSNYAVFYINVADDSKLLKDPANVTVQDLTSRDRGTIAGKGYSTAQVMAGATASGAATGGIGGAIVGGNLAGAAKGLAADAAISVVGVGAVAYQTPNFSRSQKRLQTAIALHVPNQLSIRYGTNWGEEDTSAFAMGAALAKSAGESASSIVKSVTSAMNNNLTDAGQHAKNSVGSANMGAMISSAMLSKGPGAAAVSIASGLAANPRKEQAFKSVDFRTFQFSYDFYPRSSEEAQNVLNIIYQFKLHMHPEFKDANNFLYIYPSEFDIFYYQGTQENMNLHRHTSCVLTEMTVNYSPQGQFTTFPDGMPTQININLSFRELALMTKEKIQDGF